MKASGSGDTMLETACVPGARTIRWNETHGDGNGQTRSTFSRLADPSGSGHAGAAPAFPPPVIRCCCHPFLVGSKPRRHAQQRPPHEAIRNVERSPSPWPILGMSSDQKIQISSFLDVESESLHEKIVDHNTGKTKEVDTQEPHQRSEATTVTSNPVKYETADTGPPSVTASEPTREQSATAGYDTSQL